MMFVGKLIDNDSFGVKLPPVSFPLALLEFIAACVIPLGLITGGVWVPTTADVNDSLSSQISYVAVLIPVISLCFFAYLIVAQCSLLSIEPSIKSLIFLTILDAALCVSSYIAAAVELFFPVPFGISASALAVLPIHFFLMRRFYKEGESQKQWIMSELSIILSIAQVALGVAYYNLFLYGNQKDDRNLQIYASAGYFVASSIVLRLNLSATRVIDDDDCSSFQPIFWKVFLFSVFPALLRSVIIDDIVFYVIAGLEVIQFLWYSTSLSNSYFHVLFKATHKSRSNAFDKIATRKNRDEEVFEEYRSIHRSQIGTRVLAVTIGQLLALGVYLATFRSIWEGPNTDVFETTRFSDEDSFTIGTRYVWIFFGIQLASTILLVLNLYRRDEADLLHRTARILHQNYSVVFLSALLAVLIPVMYTAVQSNSLLFDLITS